MTLPMIRIKDLSKFYDGSMAVDSLNLEVNKGELFGLIGPNGAGKTTTIKMLCCLIKPTKGTAIIDGIDILESPLKIKEKIGYLAEGSHLYEDMSVRQYLSFFSELYEIEREVAWERMEKYLRDLNILDRIDSKIGNLSKGMQRKVGIVRALLNEPKILIFDEPTTGLDPITAHFVRDFMKSLVKKGRTVLMSTHYLHEAESICDSIAILDKGRLIIKGRVEEIKNNFGNGDRGLEDIFIRLMKNNLQKG